MKKHVSTLLFFATAMVWGFAFAAQKQLAEVPVLTVGSIRNLLAALFLFASIPLMDRICRTGRRLISGKRLDFTKKELVGGALCGTVLAIASTFQQMGLSGDTDAGKGAFISALYVLIVPIFSLIIGKRSPLNVWVGVGVAVLGFYLLCIKNDFTVVPSDMMVLMCSVIFALHIMVIDKFSPGCDGVRMSCIQFFTAFVLTLPLSLAVDGLPDLSLIASVFPALLYYGVCSGGLAYTMQIIGQGLDGTNPAVASVILSLESVFGVLGGMIFLGEVMSPKEYIGCAVVFVAVIISQLDMPAIKAAIKRRRGAAEGCSPEVADKKHTA